MKTEKQHPVIFGAQAFAILMLALAIFSMPSSYYSLLRCVVVIAMVLSIYDARQWDVSKATFRLSVAGFALLAIIFNPIYLCTFYRMTWGFLDLVSIAALVWATSAPRKPIQD